MHHACSVHSPAITLAQQSPKCTSHLACNHTPWPTAVAAHHAEGSGDAAGGATVAGEPFYAMVSYATADGAHVTFGDRQDGVLPLELMSRHTAALVAEAQHAQQQQVRGLSVQCWSSA